MLGRLRKLLSRARPETEAGRERKAFDLQRELEGRNVRARARLQRLQTNAEVMQRRTRHSE